MSGGEVFEADTVLVRRNRWLLGVAGLPAVIPPIVALAVSPAAGLAVAFHAFLFALVFVSLAWRKNPWPEMITKRVRAHDGALRLGEHAFFRKGELLEGLLVPSPGARPHVLLKRRGFAPRLELEVGNNEEGRRLLRALGFDASQTVAAFRLASFALAKPKIFTLVAVLLGGLAALTGVLARSSGGLLLPFVIAPIVLVALLLGALPSKLQVGADGVLLSWLWRKRFIPHARIRQVVAYESSFGSKTYTGVDLLLDSGDTVRLPVGQKDWDSGRTAAVCERIRETNEAASGGGTEVVAALLERRSDSVADWIRSLRGIGAGANASLRTAPVPPERLWRIVEDASAEPLARAGAAVALGADLDEDRRARLLGVAKTIAAPRLRVAIEQVVESKADAELEEALAKVEEAEAKATP